MEEELVREAPWPHGATLRRIREKAGAGPDRPLAVAKAAHRIDRSRETWVRWEKGDSAPDAESLRRLVEEFGVPPAAIGYEAPEGWELVPAEWLRSEFEQLHAAIREVDDKLDQMLGGGRKVGGRR